MIMFRVFVWEALILLRERFLIENFVQIFSSIGLS